MTYDELINGDDAAVKQIERAYLETHGHAPNITDQAHNIWRLLREGWTLTAVLADIRGEVVTQPPVPPSGVDLTSWPRRGATIAASLLDTRWDYESWASMLGGIFAGRGLTQVNVLSALWTESAPHMQHPFRQRPDGMWDLRDWNPLFFDRLRRYVETMNQHGVYVLLCFLELYSWSFRKTTAHDKRLSPVCHNVNGINWLSIDRASDDRVLKMLPDAWLLELIAKCLDALRGLAFGIVPFNEGPEKAIHLDIAAFVQSRAPEVRVVVNRNEDTPGQYMNMHVGEGLIDMIAFHGWERLSELDRVWPAEPPQRPKTFRQFFAMRSQDGRPLDIDFSRVICSSDGSRSSDDPVDTYDWPALLDVFRFVADKGGNIEHQSRAKMTPGARLDMVEQDFLKQIADL